MRNLFLILAACFILISMTGCPDHGHDHDNDDAHSHDNAGQHKDTIN